MPNIYFDYERIDTSGGLPKTLIVTTGANQISWGYNLNTQSYATYAGEVVQVLSTNIDDLEIVGEVKSYSEMETIYAWFLQYMLKATQGYAGESYVETPVIMTYPERGWSLAIKPIQMPGMRYGRDVIIPQWRLKASIVDPDPIMDELTVDYAQAGQTGLQAFGRLTADIGYRRRNPFSDPNAVITKEEADLYPRATHLKGIQVEGSGKEPEKPDPKGIARVMNEQFTALMGGQFSELADLMNFDGSKPSTSTGQQPDNKDTADTAKTGDNKGG